VPVSTLGNGRTPGLPANPGLPEVNLPLFLLSRGFGFDAMLAESVRTKFA
jgi:hypothetical protein